jgi:TolA-binding protein
LQDNWRLSSRQPSGSQPDLAAVAPGTPPGTTPEAAAQPDALRNTLLQDIPLTPELRAASNQKIENSLFALGNIYREKLDEPAKAIETYEKLIARFPSSNHAPEVYYALYLLYKNTNDPKQQTYATRIKQQFPTSRFAKLIDNPNYMAEVSAGNAKVRALFDTAFDLYENQKFKAANETINTIRRDYPNAELMDRVDFLNVLIIAKTEQPSLFKLALQKFVKTHPNSNLMPKAQEYLDAFALYESGKLSEAEFDKMHPAKPKPMVTVSEKTIPPPTTGTPPAPKNLAKEPAAKKDTASPATVPNTAAAKSAPEKTAFDKPAAEKPAADKPVADKPTGSPVTPANTPPATATTPTPVVPDPPKAKYTLELQAPQLVLILYPKGHAAFAGIADKMKAYNDKYNGPDKLTVETASFNATQDMVIIREFVNGPKAKTYTIKQKSPQSPLSKIRGIEFATFVISATNLPVFLKEGNLEEYLTFYKNNY